MSPTGGLRWGTDANFLRELPGQVVMLPITAPWRQEAVAAMVSMMTIVIGIAEVIAAFGAVAFVVVVFILIIIVVVAVVVVIVVYGIVSSQQSAQTKPMPHAVFRWRALVDVRKQSGLAPYAS